MDLLITGQGIGFRRSTDGEDEVDESLCSDRIFGAEFEFSLNPSKLRAGFVTYSDIWLPFDIFGTPQLDTYVANFDRILNFFLELNESGDFDLYQIRNYDTFKQTQVPGYMVYNYKDDSQISGIQSMYVEEIEF